MTTDEHPDEEEPFDQLTVKDKIDLSLKLIQYSTAAIVMAGAFTGFFLSQNIIQFQWYLLIPFFFFTASLSGGISSLMYLTDEEKNPDWLYSLICRLHKNLIFQDWYLFLMGAVSIEIILLWMIYVMYK